MSKYLAYYDLVSQKRKLILLFVSFIGVRSICWFFTHETHHLWQAFVQPFLGIILWVLFVLTTGFIKNKKGARQKWLFVK